MELLAVVAFFGVLYIVLTYFSCEDDDDFFDRNGWP